MRLRISGLLLALALLGLVAAGCGDDDDAGGRTRVVTTLPLFADMIQQIGGDRVSVTSLLPPGSDPHTYEPPPRDVRAVADADVAYVNGLGLEPSAEKVIQANLKEGGALVELGPEVAAARDIPAEGADPHLWMSPDNAREYVRIIRDTLSLLDPAGAASFRQNYDAYLARLDETAQYMDQQAQAVPQERRKLVTTHSAFGYLADYLGFEVAAVVAVGPGQEPSPEDVANITRAIEEQGIPAVFSEPQISGESSILEQAAADAGAEVCTLYSDSLDDMVTGYIELLRFDIDEIVRCLGGTGG